ncbi:MAG: chromosomal replication initiator protein DnaA [Acidobacteriota bacterium]|jgi:chromosomal replication initiator protein|nr:chromosomal replication initiator protein DnaA [Acidobacteriota bacterium]
MDVWNQVLSSVKEKISKQSFDTWFRPIVCQGIENGSLHLLVPSEGIKKCLLEDYLPLLVKTASEVAHKSVKLAVSVKSAAKEPKCGETSTDGGDSSPYHPAADDREPFSSSLNQRYTFDTFVEGKSNNVARAAARAAAEKPAKIYNPLYLYGGSGLGKTHLMHAIGNLVLSKNPNARVSYITAEQFMNEFTAGIRWKDKGQMDNFRQKFRTLDVLLIDDIQFLAGKDGTQQEFFNTFNSLHDAQKQIVVASDCAPKQLERLEERLHSRLEWGLTIDIQPPDFETKLAILKSKAQADLPDLDNKVAMFIADGIRSNIRELEGALTRLIACASLHGVKSNDIDIEYARKVLKGIVVDSNAFITSESIMRAVANHFSMKPAQLKAKSNAKPIVVPRQIAMILCRDLIHISLPQIGKEFGGKHHTTVLHAIRKMEQARKDDPALDATITAISNSVKQAV